MQTIQSGQNTALADATASVSVSFASGTTIDVSAYVLGATGKVSGDADMVFYGQTRDGSGAVSLSQSGSDATVRIDTDRLPSSVERVAVCAAVDLEASPGRTFASAVPVEIVLGTGSGVATASFSPDFKASAYTAVVLCEVYRRDGKWKFRAVGQGFAGGLKPLSEMYGVAVDDDAPAAAPHAPAPVPAAAAAAINLSKISLTKDKPSISLVKKGASFGTVAVNLNWNRGTAGKGFFGRGSGAVDLDLGCLYELSDGTKGVVQALGKAFGSLDRPPFIALSGDDRSGADADGEWLRIAGDRWTSIRRVLVYAYIYGGVPNWASTDGIVTVTAGGQPPVEVRMDETSGLGMCAVALLENDRGEMRIDREVRYFKGHSEMDRTYGWNMNWRAGSK